MKQPYIVDTEKNRIEFLDTRFYQDDQTKEFFPSVTTILEAYPKSAAFYEWLKKVGDRADEIRDEFGNRGSRVHQMTEMYDMDLEVNLMEEGRPTYTSTEWNMFEKYVEFIRRFNPEIEQIESNYCSSRLGFGGTLDRVMKLNGKRVLMDIKTSNSIHNHYWLQQAAYVKLYEAFNETKIDQTAILWLNAKTRTEGKGDAIQGVGYQLVFSPRTIEKDWELFNATHALWLQENGKMKPKNISYKLTHKR